MTEVRGRQKMFGSEAHEALNLLVQHYLEIGERKFMTSASTKQFRERVMQVAHTIL